MTYEVVDMGSDYEALSSTAAIVNSNDVARLYTKIVQGSGLTPLRPKQN